MNIAIFTNTYKPHVGGVANSVERLARAAREEGHRVCVVAPTFPDMPDEEDGNEVIRLPAIQNFNGSDFSVSLPAPLKLREKLREFDPDLIHAQHPFLLGDTAIRWAETHCLPLLFTHHTMYEQYTHYVPADSPALKRFVIQLCTSYANLCDHVIAPSESIKRILQDRGVTTPITPIPTGVDCNQFQGGSGKRVRHDFGIPDQAFVLGHVGRLAPEKYLIFLGRAAARFMRDHADTWLVVVGEGTQKQQMQEVLEAAGVGDRTVFTGVQTADTLVDLYAAMDVFLFSSRSETQGMVLAEAMAAGVPVVGLDANGVRDIISHGVDGFLVEEETPAAFSNAIYQIKALPPAQQQDMVQHALQKAEAFSKKNCLDKMLQVYKESLEQGRTCSTGIYPSLEELMGRVKAEWQLWTNRVSAAVDAIGAPASEQGPDES